MALVLTGLQRTLPARVDRNVPILTAETRPVMEGAASMNRADGR
jgi:hypothetical protein